MLTEDAHRFLAFEEAHPAPTGKKADLILFTFGISRTEYYQRLRYLSTQPDAVEAFPMVCKRVQRSMRQRTAQRLTLLDLTAAI
jgi:hypothetical protein